MHLFNTLEPVVTETPHELFLFNMDRKEAFLGRQVGLEEQVLYG